jgi:hypothetical protein
VHLRHLEVNQLLHGTAFSVDEYKFSVGTHVLTNLDAALSWTIGIPKGIYGHWELGSERKLLFLQIFGPLACIGALCLLFTSRRWILLLGIAWFLITLGPALPLEAHFLPYYLFAPLMGFALAAGAVLDWVYAQCSRISSAAAVIATLLLFAGWGRVHSDAARRLAAQSIFLGEAARISGIAYQDILAAYPTFPEGARLILFNEGIPDGAFEVGRELFQLAYDNPSLIVQYSSTDSFSHEAPDAENIIAFKWVGDHFVDVTPFVRRAESGR